MPDPEKTWQDVAEVILNSWPAGPGSKGWERDQLAGYVAELQSRNLTAHWAIKGLRASLSAFVPSAGEVLALAREAMPPLTAVDIEEAKRLHRERRREEQARELEAPAPAARRKDSR